MTLRDKRCSLPVALAVPLGRVLSGAVQAYSKNQSANQEGAAVDAFELLDFLIADSNNPREAIAEFLAEVRREERASIVKEVRAFCARYSTPLEAPERAALTRLAAELEESVVR